LSAFRHKLLLRGMLKKGLRVLAAKSVGPTVFALVLFSVGTLFGALGAASLPAGEREAAFQQISTALVSYASTDTADRGGSVREELADAFLAHWKWIGVIALAGLSVVGLPVAWFVVFLKGALLGFTIVCLVSRGTADGWAALAAVAPQQLIASTAVVLTCAASTAFAASVIRRRFSGEAIEGRRLARRTARYAAVVTALTALVFVAAAVETFVSPALAERALSIAGRLGTMD